MNIQSILLLAAVVLAAALALYRYMHHPDKGCGCSGCEGCGLKDGCTKAEKPRG